MEGSYFPEQTSHVLFQLTGCLRNVANNERTHPEFVTSGTLTAICKTIRLFSADIDLVVNVARILRFVLGVGRIREKKGFRSFLRLNRYCLVLKTAAT